MTESLKPIIRASERILRSWSAHAPQIRSLVRIIVGLMLLEYGLAKTFSFPASISKGEPLPPLIVISGLLELICGATILMGIFTRLSCVIVAGEMAIVYWTYFFPRSPLPAVSGGDLPITWCFLLLYLSAAGGGPFAFDAVVASRRTAVSAHGRP